MALPFLFVDPNTGTISLCQETVQEMERQLVQLGLNTACLVAFTGANSSGSSTAANAMASFAENPVTTRPGQHFEVDKGSLGGHEFVWVHPSPVVTSARNAIFVLDTVPIPSTPSDSIVKILAILNMICRFLNADTLFSVPVDFLFFFFFCFHPSRVCGDFPPVEFDSRLSSS